MNSNTPTDTDCQSYQASLGIDTIPQNLHPLVKLLQHVYAIDSDTITVALDAVFGIAGQASFDVQRPSDNKLMPIGDFFCIAADSGLKKDTLNNLLTKPIREKQSEWEKEHKQSKQSSPAHIVLINSATTEGIRDHLTKGLPYLALVTGEICTFLGGYSMKPEQKANTLGSMSRWWDGSADTTITALRGMMQTCNSPRFSALIWGQPELVKDFMFDEKAVHQGLLNRFLPHIANDFIPTGLVQTDIDSETIYLNYCKQINNIMSSFHPENYEHDVLGYRQFISIDADAYSRWERFYLYCQILGHNDRDFLSYWVRVPEHCLRGAARQNLMRITTTLNSAEKRVITFEDMERAIKRSLAHAKTARLLIIEGDYRASELDAAELERWLRTQEPKKTERFPESFITQHFPRRRLRDQKKVRLRALERLCEQGILLAIKSDPHTYYALTMK